MDKGRMTRWLNRLRRFAVSSLVVILAAGLASFFFFKDLLGLLLDRAGIEVYYFTLPEAFFSSVEMSIFAGAFFSAPILAVIFWKVFQDMFGSGRVEGLLFLCSAVLLFYGGGLFCYAVVLRSGVKFLLGYGGGPLMAMISVERFTRFSAAMIFAFGLTFQVPVVLLVLSRMGLVRVKTLTKTRRYAIIFIAVASAVITPTPDVYNMMLLALPMYILYEAGILLVRVAERVRKKPVDPDPASI